MLLNCGVGELLRAPWTARRSNQSILKEISAECSLEGLMLKLQYFGHLMQSQLIGKDTDWARLRAGGERGDRGWDGWKTSLMWWTWTWVNSGRWWGTGRPGYCSSWGHRVNTTGWLNNNNTCWSQGHTSHCYVYPLRRNQNPAASLHCFLTVFPFFLHSLSLLISNCLNLPFRTLGMSGRLKSFPTNKKQWTQKSFVSGRAP